MSEDFLDEFKQKLRPEDRPASKDFKKRWNDWIELLKEKRTLDENDLIDWRLSWGLTGRRFREEYLDPSLQRGIVKSVGRNPPKYQACSPPGPAIMRRETELRYDVESIEWKRMPKEEPSETPFTDYANEEKLKEVNTVRQKMGLEPLKEIKR